MHIRLLLLFTLVPASILSMEQQVVANPIKKAILVAFEQKRAMLSGMPEAHKVLRLQYTKRRALSLKHHETDNYNFFNQMLKEQVLVVPHPIQAMRNSIHQSPDSTQQEKDAIQTAFDTMYNATTFFISDQDEDEKNPDGFSSRAQLNRLLNDPENIDLWNRIRNKTNKPKPPATSLSHTNFFFNQQASIGVSVLNLCTDTLSFDRLTTRKQLIMMAAIIQEELEQLTQELEKEKSLEQIS